jgi:hypothetical protein
MPKVDGQAYIHYDLFLCTNFWASNWQVMTSRLVEIQKYFFVIVKNFL